MSRSRDLADSGVKANYLDNIASDINTQLSAKAPIASPTFTGTTNVSSGVTLPSGYVLQVVHGYLNTNFSSTTAGQWLDVGQKATITPSSTSSKILVFASGGGMSNSDSGYNVQWAVMQPIADSDSNIVFNTSNNRAWNSQGPVSNNQAIRTFSLTGLDSPSSTSALTYGVMIKGEGTGTSRTQYYNRSYSANMMYLGITLMEISA